jgi:hypothetical protein
MIANDTIVNADINSAAAIVDTKLATIATAGKVSNSATTATSANTASAIVARDASGNFTAGTITAALTGAASSNVLKAGDTMTGALVVPLASAATPSLTFTGDLNTGIYSPGADQLAISTNGTRRLEIAGNEIKVGAPDSNTVALEIGAGATGNRAALIDFVGDTTYTDYGFRVSRDNLGANTNSSLTHRGTGNLRLVSEDAGAIAFLTTNTERARIDSSGRLLMGTSNSYSQGGFTPSFQQQGTSVNSSSIGAYRWSADAGSPNIGLAKSRGSAVGTNAIVLADDLLGSINFSGDDGINLSAAAARIGAVVDGTPGANDMPGRLVFSVTLDGAASPTEALRITNDRVVAYNQAAPATVNTTATITAANLKTGIITSSTAAAVTMTLPTGTDIEAGFSGIYTNFTFEFSVINTGPSALTVGANSNTTVGSLTVAAGTSARYALRRTGANAFTLYRLS